MTRVVPPCRSARAAVLTCSVVVVGVAAHLAAGGEVTPGGLALAFPVLLGLAWSLGDRERDWLPLAGIQLAGQQVVHAALGWGAHHPAGATALLPDDVFLYGHVVAAALLAAWLRCGERRAWATARRAARAVVARLTVLVTLLGRRAPARPPLPPRPVDAPPPGHGPLLRHAVVRRGPPLPV